MNFLAVIPEDMTALVSKFTCYFLLREPSNFCNCHISYITCNCLEKPPVLKIRYKAKAVSLFVLSCVEMDQVRCSYRGETEKSVVCEWRALVMYIFPAVIE